jgi:hypothetical protein
LTAKKVARQHTAVLWRSLRQVYSIINAPVLPSSDDGKRIRAGMPALIQRRN